MNPMFHQDHNAKINHFRIRAFTRKQVLAWFRKTQVIKLVQF